MIVEECVDKIWKKINSLRKQKVTGRVIFVIDLTQGGVGSVHYYRPTLRLDRGQAIFSGSNGPVLMEKED